MIQAVLILLITNFLCVQIVLAKTFAPDHQETLLVIGQDRQTIEDYIHETYHIPAGTMIYTSIQELKGLYGKASYGAGYQDGKALLKNYKDSVIQVGLYMVNGLEGVIQGKYDNNLRRLSDWIKESDRPIYLRIGYEFDLPENWYEPQQYVQAYKYIVYYLKSNQVQNVNYVWHSYCNEKTSHQWMDWYPGDEYVDWFACSIFSTNQMPIVEKFYEQSNLHQKEFMIAESSPYGLYTLRGKKDWYEKIFQFVKNNKIGMFCYINSNWDALPMFKNQGWGDARIQKDQEIKKLWLKEISNEKFIYAQEELFSNLGWNKDQNNEE